jgi:hypothetical protein
MNDEQNAQKQIDVKIHAHPYHTIYVGYNAGWENSGSMAVRGVPFPPTPATPPAGLRAIAYLLYPGCKARFSCKTIPIQKLTDV